MQSLADNEIDAPRDRYNPGLLCFQSRIPHLERRLCNGDCKVSVMIVNIAHAASAMGNDAAHNFARFPGFMAGHPGEDDGPGLAKG